MSGEISAQVSPTRDEVLSFFESLSNWGRWGKDDELGTLNLITPEVRLAATKLVTDGEVVPLGMDLDADNPDPLGRGTKMTRETDIHKAGTRMQGVREWIGMMPHGSATHVDAPSHFGFGGVMYNGFSASEVTPEGGAKRLSVHNARDGVVTRGVLLDIAGARGVDWLDPGEGVMPEDLEKAEQAQGVRVGSGDFLIVRTGYLRRAEEAGPVGDDANGYHAACLPWLKERDVAVIASDALNDMQPSPYGPDRVLSPDRDDLSSVDPELLDLLFPVHAVSLVAMGAWLVDNVVVESLLETCKRFDRWEFLIAMIPLRLVGSSGCQVNPLAIF
jgi:kynurenine formamidase